MRQPIDEFTQMYFFSVAGPDGSYRISDRASNFSQMCVSGNVTLNKTSLQYEILIDYIPF